MQIIMDNAQISVGTDPMGNRVLQLTDIKSGITVAAPMVPEAARKIGAALSSSLLVAPGPLPQGNGGLPH